ncbi:hypothetical protein [Paraoerskovia sediminicola]|nr:hypothetical protein [Paraoerskovia sediminicola]
MADVVHVRSALPHHEYLALARRMDWLVVTDATTHGTFSRNPYLPSKYADYRGAGAKIWGIVEPGSVLSTESLDATSLIGDAAGARRALDLVVGAAHDDADHGAGD